MNLCFLHHHGENPHDAAIKIIKSVLSLTRLCVLVYKTKMTNSALICLNSLNIGERDTELDQELSLGRRR